MNQDVNEKRKLILLWTEVSKVSGGKVENFNRIKDGNGKLALEEVEMRRIWKEYFGYLYVALMGFGKTTNSEES